MRKISTAWFSIFIAIAILSLRANAEDENTDIPSQSKPNANDAAKRYKIITEIVGNRLNIHETSLKKTKAPFIGVTTTSLPDLLRKHLKLPNYVGRLVISVEKESPGRRAGLKKDDILCKLNDQILINQHQFSALIRMHKKGDEITLEIIRSGERTQVAVTLAEKEMFALQNEHQNFAYLRMEPYLSPPGATSNSFKFYSPSSYPKAIMNGTDIEKHAIAIAANNNIQRRLKEQVNYLQSIGANGECDNEEFAMELQSVLGKKGALRDIMRRINQSQVEINIKDLSSGKIIKHIKIPRKTSQPHNFRLLDTVHNLRLTTKNGKLHLTAKQYGTDKILFEGYVESSSERESVPEEIRKKLKDIIDFGQENEGEVEK